jgi:hypothetical protein
VISLWLADRGQSTFYATVESELETPPVDEPPSQPKTRPKNAKPPHEPCPIDAMTSIDASERKKGMLFREKEPHSSKKDESLVGEKMSM